LAYSDDAKGGNESSLKYSLAAGDVRIEMRLSRIHESGACIKINCERGQIRVDKANENEVIITPFASMSRLVRATKPFACAAWPSNFRGSFCQMLVDFERTIEGHVTRLADVTDAERTAGLIEWAYGQRSRKEPITQNRSAWPSDSKKVLVTGGTGFIGGHLVERLTSSSNGIRVAARTPGKCANVSRFPVDIVPTDLLDRASVRRAVAGAQFVYHLAYGTDGKNPARITIDGTKNIVEAAIEAGAECVVVLSTMYVFGFPRRGAAVDESFPYRPYGGEYGRSKAVMERWCLARARSSLPTRIVILNPTCVFGPGGGAYTSLPVDLARRGQFCWIDDGTGLCNYTYVANLIDAILAATQIPGAHGNRFIINDGAISWREFLEPMIRPVVGHSVQSLTQAQLRKLPRHGPPFRIIDLIGAAASATAVRDVAKRSNALRRLVSIIRSVRSRSIAPDDGGPLCSTDGRPLPPEWLATLYSPATTTFSAKKANDVLHWRPLIDLSSGVRKTVDWLVETGRMVEDTHQT
jgi:nucleoside-diphosphate-sugar epimerase